MAIQFNERDVAEYVEAALSGARSLPEAMDYLRARVLGRFLGISDLTESVPFETLRDALKGAQADYEEAKDRIYREFGNRD
jgi:hypothetical protein